MMRVTPRTGPGNSVPPCSRPAPAPCLRQESVAASSPTSASSGPDAPAPPLFGIRGRNRASGQRHNAGTPDSQKMSRKLEFVAGACTTALPGARGVAGQQPLYNEGSEDLVSLAAKKPSMPPRSGHSPGWVRRKPSGVSASGRSANSCRHERVVAQAAACDGGGDARRAFLRLQRAYGVDQASARAQQGSGGAQQLVLDLGQRIARRADA